MCGTSVFGGGDNPRNNAEDNQIVNLAAIPYHISTYKSRVLLTDHLRPRGSPFSGQLIVVLTDHSKQEVKLVFQLTGIFR